MEVIGKLTYRGFSQQSVIESSDYGGVGSRTEVCQALLFSVTVDIDLNTTKRNLFQALFTVNYLYFHPEDARSNQLKANCMCSLKSVKRPGY